MTYYDVEQDMTESYFPFKQPQVILVLSSSNKSFQVPYQPPFEHQLINRLDHDARPSYVRHIPVSLSVWSWTRDAGFECLRPGEIKLLLVAFDSQLKIFYPLKNNNASADVSLSFSVPHLFDPRSDPAEGSLSLSLSLRYLFRAYVGLYDLMLSILSRSIFFSLNSIRDKAASYVDFG
uniref:Uncharacterized protein n=1 Tax=Tanacetum cinerariifolium TaxID=118510 RepID=A0A6L2K060_TANCI|nr:hypothetical protein [Tanacetum cinerariifolium]